MFEINAGLDVHEQIQAKTVIHPIASQKRKDCTVICEHALHKAEESGPFWSERSGPAVLGSNGGVPGRRQFLCLRGRSVCNRMQDAAKRLHRCHLGQRGHYERGTETCQDTAIDDRRRTSIAQCKLERHCSSFPRALQHEGEVHR